MIITVDFRLRDAVINVSGESLQVPHVQLWQTLALPSIDTNRVHRLMFKDGVTSADATDLGASYVNNMMPVFEKCMAEIDKVYSSRTSNSRQPTFIKLAGEIGYPADCAIKGDTYDELVETWNMEKYGTPPLKSLLPNKPLVSVSPELGSSTPEKKRGFFKKLFGLV